MKDIRISVTEDYESLVPFFIDNELEFSEDEPVPTDIVKCWEVRSVEVCGENCAADEDGMPEGRLIGGFVLALREGEFIVDGVAIDREFRKRALGKSLLERGVAEARRLGGRRIYLVARAPEFFRKHGFVTVGRDDAPDFFECLTCPQYGKGCTPEVMRLDIS